MKEKGFTLIELLAVIVILAIIALIATPIILGIINNAREEANKRSVELYASAIKNGIAMHQLKTGEEVSIGTYTSKTLPFEVEYDGDVECNTVQIKEDGTIYLGECTVNGDDLDYTYGTKQETAPTQVYKPQYYGWFSGWVGETAAPSDLSSELPTGKNVYLGYDVDSNNKVSAAYVCFVRNETEYCLKGYDTSAFATNTEIIKDAYSDVVDTVACSFDGGSSSCYAGDLRAVARSFGDVDAYGGSEVCDVYDYGLFDCR